MSRSATGCIACILALLPLLAAAADFRENVAISNLRSGGTVLFLTVNAAKGTVYVSKGLPNQQECSTNECKPNAAQSFTFATSNGLADYPNAPFALKINNTSKFVSLSGSSVVAKAGNPTTWTVDHYGRIKSGGKCLDVPLGPDGFIKQNVLVIAKNCDTTSVSQQWVVMPSVNRPSPVAGYLMSLDIVNGQQMCLQAPSQDLFDDPTLVISPIYKRCNASEPTQMVQMVASANAADGAYSTGWFRISFPFVPIPGAKPPQNVSMCMLARNDANSYDVTQQQQGRIPLALLLQDCANPFTELYDSDATDANGNQVVPATEAAVQWRKNSRSQLESVLQVASNYIPGCDTCNGKLLPVCLSRDPTADNVPINLNIRNNVTTSSCTLRRWINRWNLIPSPAVFP